MKPTARRIFITGQSGSGKTSLARELAECMGVPVYYFDNIAYQRSPSRKRSLDERLGDVRSILNQPAGIVDCWYLWWTEELMQAADAIIWLDLPWRVAA